MRVGILVCALALAACAHHERVAKPQPAPEPSQAAEATDPQLKRVQWECRREVAEYEAFVRANHSVPAFLIPFKRRGWERECVEARGWSGGERAQAGHAEPVWLGRLSEMRQAPAASGTTVYSPNECVGPIIMGQCHGAIVPQGGYHQTCYGEMLNGQCTGPQF